MKKKLIIIGAGGFAKSILDSLDYTKIEVIGFIDQYKQGFHQDYPIITDKIENFKNADDYHFFIAVGEPIIRRNYLYEIRKLNLKQINIIDPTALISCHVELGEGIYIGKMCIVNRDVKIDDCAVINTRSLIEHGNRIGTCTNISTNVVLNGDVIVGEQTFVGSCTVVNGQISIGSHSIIGSGSVVIRNIKDKVVVAGAPTRLIREID
ncbi:acetyltransferase [Aeromonas hydrophila]|uniref:acetyltransferase n=1 Tax=Aeromonas hydrophila TaxID=644 RepID=UPI001F4BFDF1|nr:acetyltransferase [Aeromonas hydrophila]UNB59908.1 acetyltransferase [Aeromonas hydrophila]